MDVALPANASFTLPSRLQILVGRHLSPGWGWAKYSIQDGGQRSRKRGGDEDISCFINNGDNHRIVKRNTGTLFSTLQIARGVALSRSNLTCKSRLSSHPLNRNLNLPP